MHVYELSATVAERVPGESGSGLYAMLGAVLDTQQWLGVRADGRLVILTIKLKHAVVHREAVRTLYPVSITQTKKKKKL